MSNWNEMWLLESLLLIQGFAVFCWFSYLVRVLINASEAKKLAIECWHKCRQLMDKEETIRRLNSGDLSYRMYRYEWIVTRIFPDNPATLEDDLEELAQNDIDKIEENLRESRADFNRLLNCRWSAQARSELCSKRFWQILPLAVICLGGFLTRTNMLDHTDGFIGYLTESTLYGAVLAICMFGFYLALLIVVEIGQAKRRKHLQDYLGETSYKSEADFGDLGLWPVFAKDGSCFVSSLKTKQDIAWLSGRKGERFYETNYAMWRSVLPEPGVVYSYNPKPLIEEVEQ